MTQPPLPDLFSQTADTVAEGTSLVIKFQHAARANQVVEITIRDGTGTEFARQIQLNEDGYAESAFDVPTGWISVQLLESQSLQHSIAVSQ